MAFSLHHSIIKTFCTRDFLKITSSSLMRTQGVSSSFQARKHSTSSFPSQEPTISMRNVVPNSLLMQQPSSIKLPTSSPFPFASRNMSISSMLLLQSSRQWQQPASTQSNLALAVASSMLQPSSRRTFTTSARHCDSSSSPQKTESSPRPFGEQMSLRLINENGFLSWTRNSYLSAAVAVGMLNGSNDDVIHGAGVLVLLVSAMNMGWGSMCHFTNLLRIRNRIAMSTPVLFLNLLGTVVHALLWLLIIVYYLQLGKKYRKGGEPFSHGHHHHPFHQNHNNRQPEIAQEKKE